MQSHTSLQQLACKSCTCDNIFKRAALDCAAKMRPNIYILIVKIVVWILEQAEIIVQHLLCFNASPKLIQFFNKNVWHKSFYWLNVQKTNLQRKYISILNRCSKFTLNLTVCQVTSGAFWMPYKLFRMGYIFVMILSLGSIQNLKSC